MFSHNAESTAGSPLLRLVGICRSLISYITVTNVPPAPADTYFLLEHHPVEIHRAVGDPESAMQNGAAVPGCVGLVVAAADSNFLITIEENALCIIDAP